MSIINTSSETNWKLHRKEGWRTDEGRKGSREKGKKEGRKGGGRGEGWMDGSRQHLATEFRSLFYLSYIFVIPDISWQMELILI